MAENDPNNPPADPNNPTIPPVVPPVGDPPLAPPVDPNSPPVAPPIAAIVDEASNVQRRIDVLTAEKYAANREKEEAKRQVQELQAQMAAFQAIENAGQNNNQNANNQNNNQAPSARTYSQDELNREAQRLATVQSKQLAFRERLDNAVLQGRSAYQDFDTVLGHLTRGGPLPPVVLDALVANDSEGVAKAQDVIYALGKNLGEADRILSLPPERQSIALTKFALDVSAKNKSNANPLNRVSGAPPPVGSAIGAGGSGNSSTDLYDNNVSTEDWMRLRRAQLNGSNTQH